MKFTGCGTALVTPFDENGSLDESALRNLVNDQIASGIDFLVPCGTTGESPTLSHEEHKRVIEIVIEQARGRISTVAGTGSNSTQEAIELTRHAKAAGAAGCLVVAPYYNKPTQRGLEAHFAAVADVGLPVIVYNIPGRTGVNILPGTMERIAEHPHVAGIKEATGNLEQVAEDIIRCGEKVSYLSGDDTLTLPMMSVGAHGVISVASNLVPGEVARLVRAAETCNYGLARQLHHRLFTLFQAMFVETNPGPIKAALAMVGRIKPEWRLPLVTPSEENLQKIRGELTRIGLFSKQ